MRKIMWGILVLLLVGGTGCSSLAYVTGYNLISDQEIEVKTEPPSNHDPTYSETAYVIAMVETGGGYLRKSPTLVLGIAFSPIFFLVGTVSGALDPSEPPPPKAPQEPPQEVKPVEKVVVERAGPREL